jgi:hypothetical protein
MKRSRLMGISLLATFALAAVAASTAQAEEAPFWTVKGTRLKAGQTRFITAKEVSPFVMSAGGVTITCTEISFLPHGALLGSEPGEHGKAGQTITFTNCKVSGNGAGSECEKINEPAQTVTLSVEEVLDAKTKTKLLVLLQPASGTKIETLSFPRGCKFEETNVTGSIVAEVLNYKEEAVTTSSPKEQDASWLLKFPEVQPADVWLTKEGIGKEIENKGLAAFNVPATLTGTALASLAELNSKNEFVSTGELWSPLP